ncbi:MAG: O-antigen ligase family protein, partial [Patescibacteria group bacterium]
VGTIASLALSFSRSFWLATGCMFAVFAVSIFLHIRRDPLFVFRMSAVVFGGAVMSFVLLFVISAIPFPSREQVFSVDLLSERLEDIASEAAAASRWSLLPIMISEIQGNPFFGYGFGKTLTYTSSDPRILLQNESGKYTTYAFEWGYFDLLLKLGLIGLVAYLLLLAAIFVKGASALRRCLEKGMSRDAVLIRGLLYGLSALLIVHFFTPYLNHPLGIGIVMLSGVLFERLRGSHS